MRAAALAIAILAYALAALAFRPHAGSGPILRDFEAYYAAGAAWDRGEDPYSVNIWRYEQRIPGVDPQRERLLPFVNPPPLLPVLGALARLPYRVAAAIWEAAIVVALLALLAAIAATIRCTSVIARGALLVLALSFAPVSSDIVLGQIALVAAAALAFGPALACVAALQPPIALPLLVYARSWRGLYALVASLSIFALLWIVLAANGAAIAPSSYLAILRAHGLAEGFAAIQYAPSAIAYGFGATAAGATYIGLTLAAAAVVLVVVWITRTKPEPIVALAGASALLPFVVPFFHEHDFVLLLLPALLAMARAGTSRMRSVAILGTLLCAIDWLGPAQRPEANLQAALLALAALSAIIALFDLRLRDIALPTVATAAALLLAAVLGAIHTTPVWPGSMHALGAADASTAQGVWHAEQSAAGMFVPNATGAFLRLIALIGCALVFAVIARLPQAPSDSKSP